MAAVRAISNPPLARRRRGERKAQATYETERVDEKSADGVGQHTQAKDVHISGGDEEVPEEIAGGESLDHGRPARVSPKTLLPVHLLPLLIDVHDPQGQGVDGGALDEGDDVDVPVELLGLGQRAILGGEEAGGQHGRDDAADELVEGGYYDYLVNVQREGRQVEVVGPRLHGVAKGGDGRYWERIPHAGDRRRRRRLKGSEAARERCCW